MIAPKTPGRDRVLGALAVVIFLVAMNSTIIGHAANALPGFAYATNEKLRFVTLFFVIVIGAKALESSPWWAMAAAAAPVVALAGYAYVKQRPLLRPVDLLGAATVIVALLVPRRWAGLLVALELFALNAGFNALVDARYYRPRLPIIDVLRSRAPREPFRIAATGLTFTPNASALYGLEDIRGFDPMAFASYDAYLKRFTVQDAPEMPRRLDDPAAPELDFLNVRYLLTDPTVEPGGRWREIYRGPDGGLFENPGARDRFFSPTARVEEVRELRPGEFSMRVVAPAPATVMSSEVAAPGRRVVVNGASVPIRLLHGVFISFQVPAGQSRVRVEYRAMSYWISVVVAAAAAVLMFGKRAWLDFPRAGP
jgi:hypothetical protein